MVKLALLLATLLLASSSVLPKDFAWGTATAAFQVEGANATAGRGPSIWDYFQDQPGRIYQGETAAVADDFYNRYPEDIALMNELGIKNFRLSLSWTRLFPTGDINSPNLPGVMFYNKLIDALLAAGIEPWVTLFHWDLPQSYNNFTNQSTWLNPDVPNRFNEYADFCFSNFGNRVKNWLTMNEISTFAWVGYGAGVHAPGRCSPDFGNWCQSVGGGGNSSTEPYIVAHHALISHALAVNTYRTKYQKSQGGKIGMTINAGYALPFNTSVADDWKAANTAIEFGYGWYGDPIVFGDYPKSMRTLITGDRLPVFNATMQKLLKGSYDFLGLNYYTSNYIQYTGVVGNNYQNDGRYNGYYVNASGHWIGPQAASSWLYVYPEGLRQLLNWLDKRYNKPKIIIFENGVSCPGESQMPESQALVDTFRIDYIYNHVMNVVDAVIDDGVNVKGYFYWSLLDNFEWADGYNVRFGITYVDYTNNLTRTIKDSGYYYQSLIGYLSGTAQAE